MNERNLQEGQREDRKQWILGVGQRGRTFWNRLIYIYIYIYVINKPLIHFNCCSSFGFLQICFHRNPHACYMCQPPYPPWFHHRNIRHLHHTVITTSSFITSPLLGPTVFIAPWYNTVFSCLNCSV
jgi:hypothetical protein